MKIERRSGILLHPTSLPGPYGAGDLGPEAVRWLDFLAAAGQTLWQVLPLGPTGFGDSPYQCYSVFAGNPLLLSPERLVEDGLLDSRALEETPRLGGETCDYPAAIALKQRLAQAAYARFAAGGAPGLAPAFAAFRKAERGWLEPFSLFLAFKRLEEGRPWWEWDEETVRNGTRSARANDPAVREAAEEAAFAQFLFFRQWDALKLRAAERGIVIIGDAPLYTALDSADVWGHPEYFCLDDRNRPLEVAGVPPDYFSATGQLWGNPVYRWDALQADKFAWWTARMRVALRLFDLVRLDHFRGFQAFWSVPADRGTAEVGSWVRAPGAALFGRLKKDLGSLPFFAEDLGVITDEVTALRDQFDLPGMRVLQFAFGSDAGNPFLPHNYNPHSVVYTGTHDNDTTLGWFRSLPADEAAHVSRYLGCGGPDIVWDLIRLAFGSVAERAVIPMQDALGLGSEARMNVPGTALGNWKWRFRWEMIPEGLASRLREMAETYGRISPPLHPPIF